MPLFAGFDIGGTQIKYGVINEKEEVLFEGTSQTPLGEKQLFSQLNHLFGLLNKETNQSIKAVAIGLPGLFSPTSQMLYHSPHFSALEKKPLLQKFKNLLKIPVFLHNEANLAAFGEYKKGAGKSIHSLVLLTIGTGIGTGIIFNGKIWQGASGFAGELGHITINPKGRICPCSNRGCFETEVSASGIIHHYEKQKGSLKGLTAKEINLKAKEKEPQAIQAFETFASYLGIGLATLINLLNPETIILGGGVMEAKSVFLKQAIDEAKKRSFLHSFQSCRIQPAVLGNKAGFIGAAIWAKNSFKNNI